MKNSFDFDKAFAKCSQLFYAINKSDRYDLGILRLPNGRWCITVNDLRDRKIIHQMFEDDLETLFEKFQNDILGKNADACEKIQKQLESLDNIRRTLLESLKEARGSAPQTIANALASESIAAKYV